MKVFFVAAFVRSDIQRWFSLGRQRKVNQVMDMLISFGFDITPLNIAPAFAAAISPKVVNFCNSELIPFRFFQLFTSSLRFFFLSKKAKDHKILWVYNTRAAECVIAFVALFFNPSLRLVLELEDLPSARSENGGFAGKVDLLLTKMIVRRAHLILSVSEPVGKAFAKITNTSIHNTYLLPPSLDPFFILKMNNRCEPFANAKVRILYAGSFQNDKGVLDLINAYLRLNSSNYELQLVGTAPSDLILAYSNNHAISFKGVVSEEELFELYASADVVVNPHRPILNADYIFPFKLVEIVASGALPLTSIVPGLESFDLPPICYFGSINELSSKLESSQKIWHQYRLAITNAANSCRKKYSSEQVSSRLRSLLYDNLLLRR